MKRSRRLLQVITIIVLVGFVLRMLHAGRSYWYDEFLSVLVYGMNHSSGFHAIKALAEKSIHPPLYQLFLYYWMSVFGDSEIATRTLSNLYIAGGTICSVLLAKRLFGLRIAATAAILLTCMYVPLYYGIEARSYAQSIFLSSLSSLMLFHLLDGLKDTLGRVNFRTPSVYVLLSVNAALLLTHYYNIFFLAAQGAFLLAYMAFRNRAVAAPMIHAAIIASLPVVPLLLLWGPVMVASYGRFGKAEEFTNFEMPSFSPWSMFLEMAAEPNLSLPRLTMVGLALGLSARLVRSKRRPSSATGMLYLVIVSLGPFLAAYALFLFASHERYSPRYFAYCTPPLALLLAIGVDELWRTIRLVFQRLSATSPSVSVLVCGAIAIILSLPQGMNALTHIKEDYRGTADALTAIVRGDPDHSYILFETNPRPFLNFYLERTRPYTSLRIGGRISSREEVSGNFSFETKGKELSEYDYLIVTFTHRKIGSFPKAIAHLKRRYDLRISDLRRDGRGFLIFATQDKNLLLN